MQNSRRGDADKRKQELKRWIIDCGLKPNNLRAASADASFRRYFRMELGAKSVIVMDAPPEHNNNQPFIDICQLLTQNGINVPEVLHYDLKLGFIMISDLGSQHYLDALNHKNVRLLYKDAIDTITQLQVNVNADGLPCYSENVLRTEMQLFTDWYIKLHKKAVLDTSQQTIMDEIFTLCVTSAQEQPFVFVHRDYHSRNLMITASMNPGILDFQDAVKGPVTYDIASLLKDCYIQWPDDIVYPCLEEFRHQLHKAGVINVSHQTFERWFDLMALQRHIKVMGIFCRLNYRDGKSDYMNDLPLVFSYINSVCDKYTELSAFQHLMMHLYYECG